jgi:hypothetical protein
VRYNENFVLVLARGRAGCPQPAARRLMRRGEDTAPYRLLNIKDGSPWLVSSRRITPLSSHDATDATVDGMFAPAMQFRLSVDIYHQN